MQVVKILVTFMLAIGMLFLAACYGNRVTPEDAKNVNPADYNSLGGANDQSGFRLEDFMVACGADYVMFYDDGATIVAKIKDWEITIETYAVEAGLTDPIWCTQIQLKKQSSPMIYIMGHAKDASPKVVSQPEKVLVREAEPYRPLRQRLEKATFDDLLELMNSGNLLMDKSDPLAGLSFSYLETDASRATTIHRPDGSSIPMEGSETADEAE